MSKICVIPARSGSKRVPNKNVKLINGKPMIAWTIESALASNLFDKVIVSTDNENYAKISVEYGAEVPFLRDAHSDEYSTVSEATIYALLQAEKHYKREFSYVYQLMANCPIRRTATLKDFDRVLCRNQFESMISVFQYGFMNPWWALELDKSGKGRRLFDKVEGQRSQDLPTLYCPTGSIWAAERHALIGAGSFHTKNVRYHPIPWYEGLDIDEDADFELAELLMGR